MRVRVSRTMEADDMLVLVDNGNRYIVFFSSAQGNETRWPNGRQVLWEAHVGQKNSKREYWS